MLAPALSPFPAQIWEFSGLEGKSLETNIRKRGRETESTGSAWRARKERLGSVRSGRAEGREAAESELTLLKALEPRTKQGDWEDHGEDQPEGRGRGGGSVGLWSVCLCQ